MPFMTSGPFTEGTISPSPLDNLLTAAKKKKTAGAITQPANVFAPTKVATTPTEQTAPAPGPGDMLTGETLDEYKKRMQETQDNASGAPEPPPSVTPELHYISDDPESPYYWGTLGYPDETWAGLPYEMGWWTETGEWVQQRDMRDIARQLYELRNMDVPERPQLVDLLGTDAYAGIQALIDIWNDPNIAEADKQAAVAQFEEMMGQQPGWFAEQMASMYGGLSTGIMGQEGLTPEYQDAYNRETMTELAQMQDDYTRMIEAMSAQGRNVAGYTKMNEIAGEMSSYRMKRDVERMNLDLAMKQAEYDALNDRWGKLFDMEQISAQQYLDYVNENRINALTGYAQQLSAVISQNQLTLQAYSADLEAVSLHAQIVYQGILADMQVSEGMMNEMQDFYEMYMAPYYAELEKWALEQQVEQQNAANTISAIGAGGSIITGLGLLALALPTSAICIEMYKQGYFPQEWLDIDRQFGLLVRARRPDVFSGYARLCNWVIPLMRKSKIFTKIVNIFFQPWVKDMANLMGKTIKRCRFGRFINVIGFKLCRIFGKKKGGGYYGFVG